MKIKNIITGWWKFLNGSNKAMKNERLRICSTCMHNAVGICTICGCVLKAKASEEDEHCPIKKW